MTRPQLIAIAVVAAVLLLVAEAYLGASRYRLNGLSYAIPHKYDFSRVRIWWLEGLQGLPEEPEESVWLLLPARELARDVRGYNRMFRGYASNVEADITVNILGANASDFPADYRRMWGRVAEEVKAGAPREVDPNSGWTRIIWVGGVKGTPGEDHSNFYLVPPNGHAGLPRNWLPLSCTGSPDINHRERYNCRFEINHQGLTFRFGLRQENLKVADRIPAYVLSHLSEWRQN